MKSAPQLLLPFFTVVILTTFIGCGEKKKTIDTPEPSKTLISSKESRKVPDLIIEQPVGVSTPEGMTWIPGGEFQQGAASMDQEAMGHEKPAHRVAVDGFFYGYYRGDQFGIQKICGRNRIYYDCRA